MGELQISQQQPQTTATSKPQAKPQAKENIVIEFTSLPKELKTEEVRKFYDKDGSGFLESNNSQGQNEISLMAEFAKSMGIDLMKYKSDIVKVNPQTHVGIDAQSNVIRCIDSNDDKTTIYRTYTPGYMLDKDGSSQSYQQLDANYNPTGLTRTWVKKPNGRVDKTGNTPMENGMNCKIHENWGPNGTKGENNDTIYNKNGEVVAIKHETFVRKDIKGEENYVNLSSTVQVFENKTLTKGKNTLKSINIYDGKLADGEINMRSKVPQKGALKSTTFTLNGKPVQAKSIGKGRYEVTCEQGNVHYISHDGKMLSPEYVRNNP